MCIHLISVWIQDVCIITALYSETNRHQQQWRLCFILLMTNYSTDFPLPMIMHHVTCVISLYSIHLKVSSHKQHCNLLTCLNKFGNSSAFSAFRIPFPPPPSEALIITGKPIFCAASKPSSALVVQPFR